MKGKATHIIILTLAVFALAALRARQPEIEDALVPIMTGLVQVTGLMRA